MANDDEQLMTMITNKYMDIVNTWHGQEIKWFNENYYYYYFIENMA